MKKMSVFLFLAVVGFCDAAVAQMPSSGNHDTLVGQAENYYYPEWYGDCPSFTNPSWLYSYNNFHLKGYAPHDTTLLLMKEQYTPRPIAVRGLAAMIIRSESDLDNYVGYAWYTFHRDEEYLLLYQKDASSPQGMVLLDSVEWHVGDARLLMLPRNVADTSYFYTLLVEALFDEPVLVDSVFYIAGTLRNDAPMDSISTGFRNMPTIYTYLNENPQYICDTCKAAYRLFSCRHGAEDSVVEALGEGLITSGPFFAILDTNFHQLTVVSDSLAMGDVAGGGLYAHMSYDAITAIPHAGYRFSHWNDGNTDNPRVVNLYQDTLFTAYFSREDFFYLRVASNNAEWGTVSGGGDYAMGQTATIEAVPAQGGYLFLWWDDGATESLRQVTVTSDTMFTALFAPVSAVDSGQWPVGGGRLAVYPNPAHRSLTVCTPAAGVYGLRVLDAVGRQVRSLDFCGDRAEVDVGGLAAGVYYVTVRSERGFEARMFIKQ